MYMPVGASMRLLAAEPRGAKTISLKKPTTSRLSAAGKGYVRDHRKSVPKIQAHMGRLPVLIREYTLKYVYTYLVDHTSASAERETASLMRRIYSGLGCELVAAQRGRYFNEIVLLIDYRYTATCAVAGGVVTRTMLAGVSSALRREVRNCSL